MEIGTREWVLAIKSERFVHDLDPVIRPESCKISTDISRWAKQSVIFTGGTSPLVIVCGLLGLDTDLGEFVPSATNLVIKPQTHGYNDHSDKISL